jgi:hypothetical protein
MLLPFAEMRALTLLDLICEIIHQHHHCGLDECVGDVEMEL